jgi:hypothetical protein
LDWAVTFYSRERSDLVEELKMMLAKQESRDLVQQKQINALKAGLQRVLQTKSIWADRRYS